MYRSNALKPLSLAQRKQQLRQSVLTNTGSFVDPRVLQQQQKLQDDDVQIIEQAAPLPTITPRLQNVIAPPTVKATVNYIVPDQSGSITSVITGVITGKVTRNNGVITVGFRRDSDNSVVTIRGALPVVDYGLRYTIEVRLALERGKQIYMFQRLCGEGIVAIPVGGLEFRDLLQSRIKLTNEIATIVALEVADKFIVNRTANSRLDQLRSAKIPIDHIYENFKSEIWYGPLTTAWGKLKYKFYPELLFFWDYEDLKKLSLDSLSQLHQKFSQSPIEFFLSDYTSSRIPMIPLEKYTLIPTVLKREFTEEMAALVKFLNAVSEHITETKCISLTKTHLEEIARTHAGQYSHSIIRLAISARYKFLTIVHETGFDNDRYRECNSPTRYYRSRDYLYLKIMKIRLSRIMARSPDCITPLNEVYLGSLNQEQRQAVDNITSKVNIVLVTGDGGTGKTTVSLTVHELYGQSRCLAVAAYTDLATRNHRVMMNRFNASQAMRRSAGMTIDYVIEIIRAGTKQGEKLANCTEVLLLDEPGVVSLYQFGALLELLPNLKKIFMTGDDKQCRPVNAGRVLDGFLASWSGTDYIVRLVDNRRVEIDYNVLIDNFDAFVKGRFSDIKFSTNLLDNVPFKVIKRQNYPEFGTDRSGMMKRELRPIYYWLTEVEPNINEIRIISHTNADVDDLNAAWQSLCRGGQPVDRNTRVINVGDLVRFTKPYRPAARTIGSFSAKNYVKAHLACDQVCTNRVLQVTEIYDISVSASPTTAYNQRRLLNSTSEPYTSADMVRMLCFNDGTRLNLNMYPIHQIVPGYATTIQSSIGHECNWAVVWIPPWKRRFYRELLYTAITRAKKGVVLIMDIPEDMDLSKSDLAFIWANLPKPTENALALYVPRTVQREVEEDLESFIENVRRTAAFDPISDAERREMEEELQEYESFCPLLGDDRLEKDAERIRKHFADLKKQTSTESAHNEGRWDRIFQESSTQMQTEINLSLDRTQTLHNYNTGKVSSSDEEPEIQPQKKRHFAWIADHVKNKEAQAESSQPKRLRRSTNSVSFLQEDSRTQLQEDEGDELFGFIEPEGNPFEAVSQASSRANRIIVD